MSVSVRRTVVSGFHAIEIENRKLRAVVLPSLGGRVWELTDLDRGRQWIWHRSDVPLTAPHPEARYDEVWAGGWEELFPNDAPGRFEGRDLPDHGEWWALDWAVADMTSGTEAVVRLRADTAVRSTKCTKEFRLAEDSDTLSVTYRVENLEAEGFHFLFKQHLPIALTTSCRLALPGGRVTAVDPDFGTVLPGGGPFNWPLAQEAGGGGPVDLRVVPAPDEGLREFLYVDQISDGWCGVDDVGGRAALRLRFDRGHLPFVWLFLAYGGWNGCYTAVLEPCTNMPKDLASAVEAGQSAHVPPFGSWETQVEVTLTGPIQD